MKTPSAEVLYEDLQPYMVGVFGGKTDKQRSLLDEANKRLLGQPKMNLVEATGLHKYGDNHLRPEFNVIKEAREEALDLIVIAGPIANQRVALGKETRGPLKTRCMNVAVQFIFKGLDALDMTEKVRE